VRQTAGLARLVFAEHRGPAKAGPPSTSSGAKAMQKRFILVAASVAVVGAVVMGAASFPGWATASGQNVFRLAKVDRGNIVAIVNATGTINPITTVIVGSQLSGQVVELLADYNDQVKAGQVVARLNSDQIRFRLDAAKADLDQMLATKAVQEAETAEAQRTFQRQATLRPSGATSEASFESARTKAEVTQAQSKVLTAQIAQREAVMRQIEVDLHNTEIRSPVDGVVIQRNVELGQTVAASLQSPTIFSIADDLRRMEIAANIDETDVGRIRPGQKTKFTVNAYPGREFEGIVKQVRLGSQTVSNVVIYTAVVSIENPRMELLPGMTANLRIETDVREEVIRVPNAALRWRPAGAAADGSNSSRVYVLSSADTPQAVSVRLGVTDGNATEIASGLLVDGFSVREVIIGGGPLQSDASRNRAGF
jgi:HlyD family secretion protein